MPSSTCTVCPKSGSGRPSERICCSVPRRVSPEPGYRCASRPVICGAVNEVPLHAAHGGFPWNLVTWGGIAGTGAGSCSGGSVPSTNVERSPSPTVEQVTQKPWLDHSDGSISGARPATDTTPGKAAGQQGLVSP